MRSEEIRKMATGPAVNQRGVAVGLGEKVPERIISEVEHLRMTLECNAAVVRELAAQIAEANEKGIE